MPALMALLGNLFGGIIGSIGKFLSVETLKFLAWRALIMFIVFIALPVVLYNVLSGLMFDFIEYAMSYVTEQNFQSPVVQLTGLAGYIASQIQLVQVVSLALSFVAIRFVMRFIPFFK
jgi:hypothetical protein